MTYFKLSIEVDEKNVKDADAVADLLQEAAETIRERMMGEAGESQVIRGATGGRAGGMRFDDLPDFEVGMAWKDAWGATQRACDGQCYDGDGDVHSYCCLESGHPGIHAASNGSEVVAVWDE